MERASCTVLIVEDDLLLARAVKRTLASAGISSEIVASLGSATARIARGGLDLILADLSLGDGTGYDLPEIVRNAGQATPVVLMTGAVSTSARIRAFDEGAHAMLYKPFAPDDLLAVVHACLVQQRLRVAMAGAMA